MDTALPSYRDYFKWTQSNGTDERDGVPRERCICKVCLNDWVWRTWMAGTRPNEAFLIEHLLSHLISEDVKVDSVGPPNTDRV